MILVGGSAEEPTLSLSPLFAAAAVDTKDDWNISYDLLRKDPARWIAYQILGD